MKNIDFFYLYLAGIVLTWVGLAIERTVRVLRVMKERDRELTCYKDLAHNWDSVKPFMDQGDNTSGAIPTGIFWPFFVIAMVIYSGWWLLSRSMVRILIALK
jgi:hypothetical protein